MENRSRFYDEEIAPVLLELCKKCEENGLPFVALCQFADESTGRTEFVPVTSDPAIRLAHLAAVTRGNFDLFFAGVRQDAEKHGHTSAVLTIFEGISKR